MTLSTRLRLSAAFAFLCLSVPGAQAQRISGITAEPVRTEVGQPIKATTTFDVTNNAINCTVRLHWGDGQSQDFNVNQEKDVPLVLEHRYKVPGMYAIIVQGKGGKKCLGDDQVVAVEIKAAAAAKGAAAAASVAVAPSVCPEGWKLLKGSAKKSGAFTCTAKRGTAVPEPRLSCPGELSYFENVKKGQLGCRV